MTDKPEKKKVERTDDMARIIHVRLAALIREEMDGGASYASILGGLRTVQLAIEHSMCATWTEIRKQPKEAEPEKKGKGHVES